MSSDGFLPASATSSKARKAALKSGSAAPAPKKSSKGKGKAKQSSSQPSHLLSTQPNQAQIDGDDVMTEFSERVALDEGVERKKVQIAPQDESTGGDMEDDDDEDDAIMIDPSQLPTPVTRTPISQIEQNESTASNPNSLSFAPVSHHSNAGLTQRRKVGIPPHRMTPLKRDWIKIYTPLVEECGLQVRMNAGKRQIEMKVSLYNSL
jgi:RNA-binding protein PNO1